MEPDYMMRETSPKYPHSRKSDLVDTLHGVQVPDPYRWLEDADSAETRAWAEAQNRLTRSILDGPERDAFVRELTGLFNYPRTTAPERRGGRYFFSHNPGLLNQPILYVQDGQALRRVSGQAEPRVLLDPNQISIDGTTALTAAEISPDGTRLAYALSTDGSDRQEIRVREVGEDEDLADRLLWVKFASIAWTRDGSGFYYLRFPEPGSVPPEDEQYFGRIFFHWLGDPQSADPLVFEKPSEKEVVPMVHVSAGGRWVVITAQRGASDDSEISLVDRHAPGPRIRLRSGRWYAHRRPRPLFAGFDAAYDFIEEAGPSTALRAGPSTALRAGGRLFFRTTRDAPRGRIVSVDPEDPSAALREIVPESAHRLSAAVLARETLVARYLQNASDRLLTFDLAGAPVGEIPLPGIGSITSIDAGPDHDEVLFTYTSFTQPPTSYRYDLRTHTSAILRLPPSREASAARRSLGGGGKAEATPTYATEQVWYRSKDGTRVSMFLVHRTDLPRDGDRPFDGAQGTRVLLSGYGGFNISRTPAYDPGTFPFLDRGGMFALANLRGGGEYGEAWHRAGMLERKQNVFDDFIAAAEFLIAEGHTAPGRIAIEGGSNGGLLVGAAMIQRPDLFGAVLCRVPVADMLRYHLFTVGRFWIPEYGSADDPAQFENLLKYSPYHNIQDDVRYPPTLVMTADTDDRVSPGMAKKFAARLQASGAGGPFLIRIETKAGHGTGKPVAKVIDEEADMLAFLTQSL
jgi:prolyl oligopeptidase